MSIRTTYGLTALAILFASGCGTDSEIRSYTVPAGDQEPAGTERLRVLFARSTRNAPAALPKYDVPESWRQTTNDQFSSAAFLAGPADREARITVTRTGGGAGLDAQLNRWRGQVQLQPLSLDEWKEQMQAIDMGGVAAAYVVLEGAEKSIVGAIAQHEGMMWFFKMSGPNATVEEEQQRMKSFCESVRFPSAG